MAGSQLDSKGQRAQSPQIQIKEKGLPQKKRDLKSVRLSHKGTLGRGGNSGSTAGLNDIEMPGQLDETLTSAQFILKSLMISFEMNSKQVVGLLSDNHRYLYHLCIKGFKGGNFAQVVNWYNLVAQSAAHLVSLLEMETQN